MLLALLCITSSGCFTVRLWTPNLEVELEDEAIGLRRVEDPVEVEPRTWWDIAWRVVVTPYFLALDVVTFPFLAFLANPGDATAAGAKEAWKAAR